ncbi:MAG: response regulator [Terriglobales bacterium]
MPELPKAAHEQRDLLCVDDDPNILKLRRVVLENAGYSVITASSGSGALQILANGTTVDVVLLDYLMPEMKGDELASKLRHEYPDLPLIAVSAVDQLPESLLKVVNAHVQKGGGPEVLLTTLSEILEATPHRKDSPVVVLCVEDEEIQLRCRRMIFESAGYVVLSAQAADKALHFFQTRHVDIVLMDYSLSGKSGVEIAAEMKRMRPGTPIIMLSGVSSAPEQSNPVDLWLRKMDLEPEGLVDEVRRILELGSPGSNESE